MIGRHGKIFMKHKVKASINSIYTKDYSHEIIFIRVERVCK